MIYFKNDAGVVFAYPKEDIAQTERLTELEALIQEIEPEFILSKTQLQQKQSIVDELIAQRDNAGASDDAQEDDTKLLEEQIYIATTERDLAVVEFSEIDSKYKPLKTEYDAIFPVFFDIRDNLKTIKKMTPKEVDAHLNPPISKEQLIAEAEQKKQSLLAEGNNTIVPLQDAVDLGIATDEEKAKLTAWKTYRVLLNRVDTSLAPDIDWPEKPE
ncbi:TPA: tail fiber assembly protein [Providencia rettgeri]|nr:tail fiber assembly protein [Providencia rettgeri]